MEKANLVCYCGLYCGDCFAYTGKIPNLAKELKEELTKAKYDKFAQLLSQIDLGKDFKNYDAFLKVLGLIDQFRCEKSCRNGGGSPFCEIRRCCQEKKIEGCWVCSDFENCKKLEPLGVTHGDGYKKNIHEIKSKGMEAFVEGTRVW